MSAVAQPSGTVTLVFTDVQGSTELLDRLGADAYRESLEEHRCVVRDACSAHEGYEVDCTGDAFFIAFASANAAMAAVAAAMAGLSPGPIRIRVGVHTGEPSLDPPTYVGMDVHRAARIMSAAHGGQAVVSNTTVALLEPGSVALRPLGEHRLKDLSAPIALSQLVLEGLPNDFPPLRTLNRSNFPLPATPFVGRAEERTSVLDLLNASDTRLLTLTGPGGTGKTRLALQAAAEAADSFPDGMTWVSLAPVRDPALALPAVAHALEVREEAHTPLVESVGAALAGRRALILLDNAEHLLPDVAADVSALLSACPTVRILVTSRERLQLQPEVVWPVPPLGESDGERLFVERARAFDPDFVPTAAVSELCRALDELPLAIELAAARCVVLSPEQLLERLGQRLDLLKGARDTDPRQQTLRATIEWSHELLTDYERQLFRRLSLFAGGCRIDAAEQVCGADPDTLQSLLDKSLVRRRNDADGRPRFWMLETIREYAAERLDDAGEVDETIDRLIDRTVDFAEAVRPGWHNGEDTLWLTRFGEELPNIRVAIGMALERRPSDGLAIASFLGWCWQGSGLLFEARAWISRVLSSRAGETFEPRAWACSQLQLAIAAFEMGEEQGIPLLRGCLPLLAAAGFPHEHALMLGYLAYGLLETAPAEAEELVAQAESEAREIGNAGVCDEALTIRAQLASQRGDIDEAGALYDRRLAGATSPDYRRVMALLNFAGFWIAQRETERAREAIREGRSLAIELGFPREVLHIDVISALAWVLDGDADQALADVSRARPLAEQARLRPLLADLMLAEAAANALRGDLAGAAVAWQAARDAFADCGARIGPAERVVEDRVLTPLVGALPSGR